ncbi:hypothetical protein B0H16DRAFT_1751490 [Mycena metata]|uniref:Uncharacterized protein n=1 Tax=Mycena metata TaxID=1033252 RepID=A0AAD7GGG2_9AGAR|nr:hypothetical protein B0H16DRAFT_1751490 [Mycena metata]
MLFDTRAVDIVEDYADVYDSDHQIEPRRAFAGYFLDQNWRNEAKLLARCLHRLSTALATSTDAYHYNPLTYEYSPIPDKLDEPRLDAVHFRQEEAQDTANCAKRTILSMVGFLSWFQTVKDLRVSGLPEEDIEFLHSLRLDERPKTGVIYRLYRDHPHANFPHLIKHGVPIHYPWTNEEKEHWRYLKWSPEFYEQVAELKEKAMGAPLDLSQLPSYDLWKDDLGRTDVFFQNLSAGRRGEVLTTFKPDWTYQIVDFHLHGARPLKHWNVIRAYSERFKGAVLWTPGGTTCTFFWINPLQVDEPPFDRPRVLLRIHELTDFATEERGEAIPEVEAYYEASAAVKDLVKVLYAPVFGLKAFNSFNGGLEVARVPRSTSSTASGSSLAGHLDMPEQRPARETSTMSAPMSVTRCSARNSDQGFSSRWAESMAQGRRCGSRSLSPRRGDAPESEHRSRSRTRSQDHGRAMSINSDGARSSDSDRSGYASSRREYHSMSPVCHALSDAGSQRSLSAPAQDRTRREYETEADVHYRVKVWAIHVLEEEPCVGPYEHLQWNQLWLDKCVLAFDKPEDALRMKTVATVNPNVTSIQDVLEISIRHGLPVPLYLPVDCVREFKDHSVSPLTLRTQGARYEPGYLDHPLIWKTNGSALVYGQYEAGLQDLLNRDNAVAFIGLGGSLCYIAEKYNLDLVQRFARGPSLQVTQFGKGQMSLFPQGGTETFFTRDRVSASEIGMLEGLIAGASPGSERTLWPSTAVIEAECPHWNGYLNAGLYAILENVGKDLNKRIYCWHTFGQWREYFCTGCKGIHAAGPKSTDEDFFIGGSIFDHAFPVNWQTVNVRDLEIPEQFEPTSN